jgi:hypothetical protein
MLFVAGCDFSHVKPGATVVISGRALSATGAPLPDVQVHLYKEADFGEFLVGSALALGTLGGVCLFPAAPAICRKGFTATTDATGAFRFRLKGSDTQGIAGNADTIDVVFADPKGAHSAAASTTLRFKVQHNVVRLPATRLWDAGLHVAATTTGQPVIRMSWRALTGADADYSAQLLDSTRGTSLWTQSASGTRTQIDARILEDHAALAAVTARSDLGHGVHAVYLSTRKSVRPTAGTPPSRHEPCYAITGVAPHLERFRQTVCVATDGDLESPSRLVAGNGKVVSGVLVDLVAQTRGVSLIVARGLAGTVVVEISADSHTWTRVATATGPTIAVRPPGDPLARYVRVRSPGGLDESLLTELSVW